MRSEDKRDVDTKVHHCFKDVMRSNKFVDQLEDELREPMRSSV